MFNELDVVTLTEHVAAGDIWIIPSYSLLRKEDDLVDSLQPGDIGTIVYVQGGGQAFEVEFLQPGGYTVALATLRPAQLRPATDKDLAAYRFSSRNSAWTPDGLE